MCREGCKTTTIQQTNASTFENVEFSLVNNHRYLSNATDGDVCVGGYNDGISRGKLWSR